MYTAEEVLLAIKQIQPTKTPGSYEMAPIFFQKYWAIIGEDMLSVVLKALNMFLESLNHTFISLFPKNKNPKGVPNYRPISLCNVLYKIVTKVFANRLKVVLPKIVSNTQSAFVLGCLIPDKILIA